MKGGYEDVTKGLGDTSQRKISRNWQRVGIVGKKPSQPWRNMKVNTFLNMTNYFHNCHKTQNTLTNLGSIMKDTKQAIMVKSAILKYATAAF